MDNEKFKAAREAYGNKDYAVALKTYTECLQDPEQAPKPGEFGLLYHQIGNCLVKLGDYNEAIHAFSQATGDAEYNEVGAVNYNLGMAYAVLHDYENAVKFFEVAVSDSRYSSAYKAYMGMGNALLRLGKSAEAGAAFRSAALDGANPDPTKALLNLGVCFMALNRPADAVTSYESALSFDMPPAMRNKLYANLGQAYVANHQYQQAISAFENALADKTYFLNDAASVDYQQAIAMVSTGTGVIRDLTSQPADDSGLDAIDDGEFGEHEGEGGPDDSDDQPIVDDRFFTASDEELERWSRGVVREERKKRHVGLKIFLVILILVILALAAGIFAYVQGYGYPTQESLTEQLFSDPSKAQDLYAPSVDEATIAQNSRFIIPSDEVTIDGLDRQMGSSTVYATVDTPEGGEASYAVTYVRDLIGWKIANVELYFPSEH